MLRPSRSKIAVAGRDDGASLVSAAVHTYADSLPDPAEHVRELAAGNATYASILTTGRGVPEADGSAVTNGRHSRALQSMGHEELAYVPNSSAIGAPAGTSMSGVQPTAMMMPLLDGFAVDHPLLMNRAYREMYAYDPICGSAVYLLATFPFGDFTLSGVKNPRELAKYGSCLDSLRIREMLPIFATDMLVLGTFVGTMRWDEEESIFSSILPHNIDFTVIEPLPAYGETPVVRLKLPKEILAILESDDPAYKHLRDKIPNELKNGKGIASPEGTLLDPETLLYLANPGMAADYRGVSMYRRAFPIWLIEKALIRGTTDQFWKRQRPILHAMIGDDTWIPQQKDFNGIAELILSANHDPTGAVMVTRHGIDINEIRRGDDMVKWCLTGDTLIPTAEHGLIRIDELVSRGKKFTVLGGKGAGVTKEAGFAGIKPVYEVQTSAGHSICGTSQHGFRVLDDTNTLVWRRLGDLQIGDRLCVATKELHRKGPLKLDAAPAFHDYYGNEKMINLPDTMTPDLAYWLGLVVSGGSFNRHTVRFGNTDKRLNAKFKKLTKALFWFDPFEFDQEPTDGDIIGKKPFKGFGASSKLLCNFVRYLGLTESSIDERSTSYHKEVPWSILNADAASQLAFMAAYVDGDGHIRSDNISVYSRSDKLLRQVQAMAATHGCISHVSPASHALTFNQESSAALRAALDPYLVAKRTKVVKPLHSHHRGVPTAAIRSAIAERSLGRWSGRFIDDAGDEIEVDNLNCINRDKRKVWPYSAYADGHYDQHLNILKQVAHSFHTKTLELFEHQYHFVEVTSIKYVGRRETFDLSMAEPFEHSFVANGLVVHNSDYYDFFERAKLRALGISESLFSSDFSISAAEGQINIALQRFSQFRSMLTRRIFYDKIFPPIAKANGFRRQQSTVLASGHELREPNGYAERMHLRANGDFALDFTMQERGAALPDHIHHREFMRLAMPTVEWHTNLAPTGMQERMDALEKLSQAGVPIPLRLWFAAANVNVENLVDQRDADVRLRRHLRPWRKEIAKDQQTAEAGFAPPSEEASSAGFYGAPQIRRPRSPLDFDFTGDNYRLRTEVGGKSKVLSKTEQRRADEKANRNIAEAAGHVLPYKQKLANDRYRDQATRKFYHAK